MSSISLVHILKLHLVIWTIRRFLSPTITLTQGEILSVYLLKQIVSSNAPHKSISRTVELALKCHQEAKKERIYGTIHSERHGWICVRMQSSMKRKQNIMFMCCNVVNHDKIDFLVVILVMPCCAFSIYVLSIATHRYRSVIGSCFQLRSLVNNSNWIFTYLPNIFLLVKSIVNTKISNDQNRIDATFLHCVYVFVSQRSIQNSSNGKWTCLEISLTRRISN